MANKQLALTDDISHLLEECRMVLPGILALFGFQLIAVFNQRFTEIPAAQQVAHLAATGLVALSAALLMTPAAYHRSVEPHAAPDRLVHVSTQLLLVSMVLLATGIAVDFFIISSMISGNAVLSALLACALFASLIALWFVFPNWKRRE